MKTVTITECYGEREEHTSRHQAETQREAIAKAVRKAYGAQTMLYEDEGLNREAPTSVRYGQVGKGSGSQITGRVRVEVVDE